MNSSLYSKQGLIRIMLARRLFDLARGDRLPIIAELTEEFDCSRGLVQNAIAMLEETGAIVLNKRGSLGTFLVSTYYSKLWRETAWESIVGCSPLPYTKRHEGLATGIYSLMDKMGIPFRFAYMQGAETRAQAIMSGKFHFATMSKVAAQIICDREPSLHILMSLPPLSYLGGYAMAYRDKAWKEKKVLKVGIDSNSPDHALMIRSRFGAKYEAKTGQKVEFVPLPYTRMIEAMHSGLIDITIYNKDGLELGFVQAGAYVSDISLTDSEKDGTCAVILVSNEDYGLAPLLKDVLIMEKLLKTQNEVMEGKRTPIY